MKLKTWFLAMLTSVLPLPMLADSADEVLGFNDGPALTQLYIDSRFAWQGQRLNGHAVDDAQGFILQTAERCV